MNNVLRKKIIIIVIVLFFLIAIIGISYAYFVANMGSGSQTNINIITKTTDELKFLQSGSINFSATEENFAESGSNLSGNTTVTASLKANSATNKARYSYNTYVNISTNDYVYTVDSSTPELLMTVNGPNGVVTSIPGLTYKTNGGITGFDITTKTGIFIIADEEEIVSNSSVNATTESWTVTIYFINLSTNQKLNENKNLLATVNCGRKDPRVPSTYTQVEYLQSRGSQYINTGFSLNSTSKVEILYNATSSGKWIYGSRTSVSSNDKFGFYQNSVTNIYPQYGNEGYSNLPGNTNENNLLLQNRNLLYLNGVLLKTFATTTFTGTYPSYLFTINSGGSADGRNFWGNIYYEKIYDNDEIKRKFVPCKRNSDLILGMYDVINNNFYTNIGSGTFITGNIVN